jgi:hypothetical protein
MAPTPGSTVSDLCSAAIPALAARLTSILGPSAAGKTWAVDTCTTAAGSATLTVTVDGAFVLPSGMNVSSAPLGPCLRGMTLFQPPERSARRPFPDPQCVRPCVPLLHCRTSVPC